MAQKQSYMWVTNPAPATSPANSGKGAKKQMAQQGKTGGGSGNRSGSTTGKGGGNKTGGKGSSRKTNPADNPTPRRSSRRAKKNPRGGVFDSLIQVGVAATGVVLVNEMVNAVLPGATGKPIVMLGGGMAISHFAPNSKTGEKIDFIGKVIAVGGVVGIITPFVRQAFQGVRQSAAGLIGAGTEEPVGEYFHLPDSPLGEYIDLTADQMNAYGY